MPLPMPNRPFLLLILATLLTAAVALAQPTAPPPGTAAAREAPTLARRVVIRVSRHDDSIPNHFQLRILPEPEAWLALVAGAGALGALSRRRRARG